MDDPPKSSRRGRKGPTPGCPTQHGKVRGRVSTALSTACGHGVAFKFVERNQQRPPGAPPNPRPSLEGQSKEPRTDLRGVLSLAIPALGALVIEPLLLLIDSAMVGHLGAVPLAALSLAGTILSTLVGIFVFLAYSTTALTARALGAGKPEQGIRGGIEAMWLGGGIGLVVGGLLFAAAPWLVSLFGPEADVGAAAVTYLRAGAFGTVGMLVILAAVGTLRGLLDMRTPLYVTAAGAFLNVSLNFLLIYGLGLGILGAGIGLSVTQTAMAVAVSAKVAVAAKRRSLPLGPSPSGVLAAAREGSPLLVRTLSLRLALLATVAVATRAGTYALAGHQVVNSIWTLAAFALDALAIAAQSLVGVLVGGGREKALARLTRKLTLWGALTAGILGVLVALTSKWLPLIFGSSPEMHNAASRGLLVAGILMPISGVVFVLDGVLIGASEGKYLAGAGVLTLLAYLPSLLWLGTWIAANEPLTSDEQASALSLLWVAFAGWFMVLRAAANAWRAFTRSPSRKAV